MIKRKQRKSNMVVEALLRNHTLLTMIGTKFFKFDDIENFIKMMTTYLSFFKGSLKCHKIYFQQD